MYGSYAMLLKVFVTDYAKLIYKKENINEVNEIQQIIDEINETKKCMKLHNIHMCFFYASVYGVA